MLIVNPFSGEAKKILKESPPVKELPDEVFELAREKVAWKKDRKARFGRHLDPEKYDANGDVLSFHILMHSVAAKYGYPSPEARVLREAIKDISRERIWFLLNTYAHDSKRGKYNEGFAIEVLSDLLAAKPLRELNLDVLGDDLRRVSRSWEDKDRLKYAVEHKRVLPVLRSMNKSLTDIYLVNGYAVVSLNDLVYFYTELVARLVDSNLSKGDRVMDERMKELAELVSQVPSSVQRVYSAAASNLKVKGGKRLKVEFFPPCIKHTLAGVTTGSRNYAITVLLTSFISYARIAPIGAGKDSKISDHIQEIEVVTEEVLPMIYEAAEHCVPSLFEDQPLERLNISYHLGFGLTEAPRMDDSGISNWYFPPNCDKIRREAPALCNPDEHCKTIKNPLNYYAKKLFPKKKEEAKEKKKKPRFVGEKVEGKIVKIYDGSGLIARCPKCKRQILDNFCIVHSDVEGFYDLRIKARFEYSEGYKALLLNKEMTEGVLGFNLDEAK
ncbi:MAG: hypothetical protein V3T58_08540, partial [Candidatus Hydrothermarchaeales archaeon]